jgi:hypothetical protein
VNIRSILSVPERQRRCCSRGRRANLRRFMRRRGRKDCFSRLINLITNARQDPAGVRKVFPLELKLCEINSSIKASSCSIIITAKERLMRAVITTCCFDSFHPLKRDGKVSKLCSLSWAEASVHFGFIHSLIVHERR